MIGCDNTQPSPPATKRLTSLWRSKSKVCIEQLCFYLVQFRKEKLLVTLLFMNSDSFKRDSEETEGDIWRCPKKYLVTCVGRHMQVDKACSITSKLIEGSRTIVAHSVTSRLVGKLIWRLTHLFTRRRNRTIAHSATSHSVGRIIWSLTR